MSRPSDDEPERAGPERADSVVVPAGAVSDDEAENGRRVQADPHSSTAPMAPMTAMAPQITPQMIRTTLILGRAAWTCPAWGGGG